MVESLQILSCNTLGDLGNLEFGERVAVIALSWLEHLPLWERLMELGLLRLEKPLSAVPSDRKRDKGLKLKHRKFHLNTRKSILLFG